jgi:hypothetical protein
VRSNFLRSVLFCWRGATQGQAKNIGQDCLFYRTLSTGGINCSFQGGKNEAGI